MKPDSWKRCRNMILKNGSQKKYLVRTKDLLGIVEQLKEKGVTLVSNKENLDTNTPTGKLMLTMIAAINEFERENMLERQREGIAEAVKAGKYKGRKEVNVDEDTFIELMSKYKRRQLTKTQVAEQLGVSRPTLDKLIKQKEAETGIKLT